MFIICCVVMFPLIFSSTFSPFIVAKTIVGLGDEVGKGVGVGGGVGSDVGIGVGVGVCVGVG